MDLPGLHTESQDNRVPQKGKVTDEEEEKQEMTEEKEEQREEGETKKNLGPWVVVRNKRDNSEKGGESEENSVNIKRKQELQKIARKTNFNAKIKES